MEPIPAPKRGISSSARARTKDFHTFAPPFVEERYEWSLSEGMELIFGEKWRIFQKLVRILRAFMPFSLQQHRNSQARRD